MAGEEHVPPGRKFCFQFDHWSDHKFGLSHPPPGNSESQGVSPEKIPAYALGLFSKNILEGAYWRTIPLSTTYPCTFYRLSFSRLSHLPHHVPLQNLRASCMTLIRWQLLLLQLFSSLMKTWRTYDEMTLDRLPWLLINTRHQPTHRSPWLLINTSTSQPIAAVTADQHQHQPTHRCWDRNTTQLLYRSHPTCDWLVSTLTSNTVGNGWCICAVVSWKQGIYVHT